LPSKNDSQSIPSPPNAHLAGRVDTPKRGQSVKVNHGEFDSHARPRTARYTDSAVSTKRLDAKRGTGRVHSNPHCSA
jgi:hypothetical protein